MSQLQVTGEAKIRDLQGPVVANAGVITALDGLPSQYVRGDGTLADIPSVTGGGSSVSYYLNGSVNQGTFGGSTYYQLGENAITGVGTNFSASTNGLLAQFITDANVPDQTEIPSGNWNIEFYMGVSASSGALASFYVEIYKYDGTTFTLIGTNVATPEFLTNTTTVDSYFTSVAMPLTAMAQTDRIAIRVYTNVAGKTVTLYTEDNRLCQVVTTFSRGILSMNSLTDQQQYLTVGTAGTDFNIVSSVDTHTFNIPVASATNTGKLSSTDWSIFNAKQPAGNYVTLDTTQTITSEKTFSNTITFADYALMNIGVALSKTSGTPLYASTNGYANLQLVNAGSVNSLYLNDGDTGKFTKLSFNNAADYTYTFPALSGTLALLEGTQTFSGSKTFNSITNFNSGVLFNAVQNQFAFGLQVAKNLTRMQTGGYMTLSANSGTGSSIMFSDGDSIYDTTFYFDNTANRAYTFPSASGTIALTSDLGNYVTLGTAQTITGAKIFTSNIEINKSGQASLSIISTSGNSSSIFSYVGGVLKSTISTSDTDFRLISSIDNVLKFQTNANFVGSLIFSNSANYSYTFPAASGTIALTSNLNSYVPYTGATANVDLGVYQLTTSQVNIITATSSYLRLKSTYLTTGKDWLLNSSTDGNLYIAINGSSNAITISPSNKVDFGSTIGNGTYTYTLPSANGTLALTSNLSSYLPLAGGTLTGQLYVNTGGSDNQLALVGTAPSLRLTNAISGATINGFIAMSGAANNYIQGSVSGDMCIGNQNNGKILFGFGAGTATPKVTIDSTGAATFSSSVTALGTTIRNPSTDGSTPLIEIRDNSNTYQIGYLNFNQSTDMMTLMNKQGYSASGIAFGTNNTERMRINVNGNVGIGNTGNASYKLLVSGNNASVDSNGQNTIFLSAGTSVSYIDTSYTGGGSYVPMAFGTGGSERMRITSGGNVLIGTTSDAGGDYKLQVSKRGIFRDLLYLEQNANGNAALYVAQNTATSMSVWNITSASTKIMDFAWYGSSIASISVNSAGTAVAYNTTSDYRLKEDFKEIKGLDKLSAIKVYDFKWKKGNDRMDGVIAHELQEILPYAVYGKKDALEKDGSIKAQAVDYSKLVPVLVKAIQEQQEQIEELKALIAAK